VVTFTSSTKKPCRFFCCVMFYGWATITEEWKYVKWHEYHCYPKTLLQWAHACIQWHTVHTKLSENHELLVVIRERYIYIKSVKMLFKCNRYL
jgi:hypothetical protein